MTTKPGMQAAKSAEMKEAEIVQFPDPPPEEMTAFNHVNYPADPASLMLHYAKRDTTIISSELATGLRATESYRGVLFPDLLVAFDVDPVAHRARIGYLVPEQGKPPDFVMEVASKTTAHRDEREKRGAYQNIGVGEYWRFDPTGGEQYAAALAGDRLEGEALRPIEVHRTDEGHYWGHSEALGLDLCWEEGELRFWDPDSQSYLHTFEDERAALEYERAARLEAEARVQARLEAEAGARQAAEERVRELEEELRHYRGVS